MQSKFFTIQQAADKLHLSAKTLRRWEAKGVIHPGRTPGNQRRYTQQDIQRLRRRQKYQAGFLSKNVMFLLSGLLFGVLCLVTLVVLTGVAGNRELARIQTLIERIRRPHLEDFVVGTTKNNSYSVFRVNIPSVFSKKATFLSGADIQKGLRVAGVATLSGGLRTNNQNIDAGTGRITAGNILYSIRPGTNIAVTGGQNPTISALFTGVSSLQGTTGAVSLLAGTDITISDLSITDKATLSSVYARGGCSSCLTDADVGNTLTISSDGSTARCRSKSQQNQEQLIPVIHLLQVQSQALR